MTALIRNKQLLNSETYNDTLASDATLQTNSTTVGTDLDAIFSQLNHLIHGNTLGGGDNWYDQVGTLGTVGLNTNLAALQNVAVACNASLLTDITVGAGLNYHILSVAGSEAPTLVGSLADTTEGVIVAESPSSGGAFASNELTERAGSSAIAPTNLAIVVDGSTGQPIQSSNGRDVMALVQVENGFTNGGAFTDVSPNRVKLSFVRINSAGNDLEACPVADIENKTINYNYLFVQFLQNLDPACFTGSRGFVDQSASVDVTLTNAVANQAGPVGQAKNVQWDIADTFSLAFESTTTDNLLSLAPSAGGDAVTLGHGTGDSVVVNAATFDVNATTNDFAQGISVDTADQAIDIGATSAGVIQTAGNLQLNATGGNYLAGSTFTGGTATLATDSGAISLLSATSGANGSNINITAGAADAGGGSGNKVQITAGDAVGAGNAAGGVTILGGAPGDATSPETAALTVAVAADANVSEATPLIGLNNQGSGTGGGSAVNLYVGESDPSSVGVAAPVGSLFMRNDAGAGTTGELWIKTGAADTAWSIANTGAIAASTWAAVLDAGPQSGGFNPELTDGDVFQGVDSAGGTAATMAIRGGNDTAGGGTAGPVTITGGSVTAGTGAGADVSISGGAASTSGLGGSVNIDAGAGAGALAAGDINAGLSNTNGLWLGHNFLANSYGPTFAGLGSTDGVQVAAESGPIQILTATAGATNAPLVLTAGDSGAGIGPGNNVNITAGSALNTGIAGVVNVTAGDFSAGVELTGNLAALNVSTGTSGWTNKAAVINMINDDGGGGQEVQLRVGTIDPSAGIGVSSGLGSVFHRDNGTTAGELWLKVGTANTAWERITTTSDTSTETLQQAYEAGNTIVTDAANGDLDVSGTEDISFSIAANDASPAQITLQATNAGAGTGDIAISADNVINASVSSSTAGTNTVNISSQNGGAGLARVIISADDSVDIDSTAGGVSVGAALSSDFSVVANSAVDQQLTLQVSNAGTGTGDIAISAENVLNASVSSSNAGTNTVSISSQNGGAGTARIIVSADDDITVDSSAGGISLDAVTSSNFTVTGNSAATQTLTLSATNAGAGGAGLILSADDQVDIDSALVTIDSTGGISLDAAGPSNFTVDGDNLILGTTTSGGVAINSADNINLNPTGNLIVDLIAGERIDVIQAGADTEELIFLSTTGTNGDAIQVHVGNRDPNGAVTAPIGSLYVNGTTAALYQNTDGATAWTAFAAAGGTTPQQTSGACPVITGTDSTLTTLSPVPSSAASVMVYINGVAQQQGAGNAYTINVGTGAITWLAATGTAIDLTAADTYIVTYES